MSSVREASKVPEIFIPDFCGGLAVLRVILLTELVAIILVLAGAIGNYNVWQHLLLLSLYLQWIGLASCSVLCLARRWLEKLPRSMVMTISYVMLVGLTLMVSELAYQVGQMNGLRGFATTDTHFDFLLRNGCVSAIVSAVLLRYLYMQHMRDRHVLAGAEARFQALQARIRPHFLFNSLNSLAALIAVQPEDAESMVEDLSELFRVTLDATDRTVSLVRETDITRGYLRIEQLRLGDRLTVEWDIPPQLEHVRVPILTLQPLVENAVYHGIGQLPAGGCIHVSAVLEGNDIILEVKNPVPEIPAQSRGASLALDNIRQRLAWLFGDNASLEVDRSGMLHRARLRLPTQGEIL